MSKYNYIHNDLQHVESPNPIEEATQLNLQIAERELIFTHEIFDLAIENNMIEYWYCYNQDNTKNVCNPYERKE